ncbi:hypothetical protein ETD86_46600 [Nonomuraea turkmeniaca]|uniref:Uncharacterized protein n=1 Tax=Nonomuraea turkmeniaca TaxID=103838 RepID=A0A5S4EYF7_9ACTN|nr:hypothetical protein [Nonomuraea turkmeniaca]TMR08722.1 hypothetical protein ETD86_46600 [Nonomuraea turkmeniaca]
MTITVTCGCQSVEPEPPAAAPRLSELDLHGYTCATVLPPYITRTARVAAALFGVSAVLPAGASIASVGVAVANPAIGDAFTESRLGVYVGGIPELVAKSDHKANLYTFGGWRWAPLNKTVTPADEDRVIWLVAQIPLFSSSQPDFAAAGGDASSLLNGSRYRSVIVKEAVELPPMFDGDAVPFTPRGDLIAMAATDYGVVQP